MVSGWFRLPFASNTVYEHLPAEPAEQAGVNMSSGQEERVNQEGRKGDLVAKYSALIAVTVFLVITWSTVLKDGTMNGWFTFHPLLMSLGISLITYGILTLQPTSQPKSKAAGLARHQFAILFAGVPSIFLGALAIFYNKQLNWAKHFTTWHATFGITAVFWMLFQMLIGGGSVWFDGAVFGGSAKAKAIWKYHRLSGYLLFTTFLLTAHLGGAWSDWSLSKGSYFGRLVAFTLAPVVVLGSIYARARLSKMKMF